MLVFISSFVSPHTLPLGVELSKYYEKVIFINTMDLTMERAQMGYDVSDPHVDIRHFFEAPQGCRLLIDRAKDVILAGANFDLVANRIQYGKWVFITHERLFKKGMVKLLDPRTWKVAKFCLSVRSKAVYMLASHILLSTSHKGEGWGAVINEGMNRGRAVVC